MLTRVFLRAFCCCTSVAALAAEPPTPINFGKDILPILQRSCIECHGPQKQEGNLRLDSRVALLKGGDSGPALDLANVDSGELLRRVALPKEDPEIMPARGDPLPAAQVELLRAWVRQGAAWPDDNHPRQHWAYVKPIRPALPAVKQTAWPKNPIDRFILAGMERAGLHPSPEADPATLIRRVYLDLIGLPPTVEEVEEFVASYSPSLRLSISPSAASDGKTERRKDRESVYNALVDRLLASDQFGVRWARPWLDCARYADSHGFQRDDLRDLWSYRDWVVDALNADMPFDQFTIEQLAGDLLPSATLSQRIATGFNRNAPTNVEAGSDPEETRVNQVFDRVNTLGMVWLGTSLECAQCHDHKYDPFTMRDYYGLFAFFNNTEIEADRSNPSVPGSIRFIGPEMPLADAKIAAQHADAQARLATVTEQINQREQNARASLDSWETELKSAAADAPREHVLDVDDFDSLGGATHEALADKSVLISGEAPDRDTYTVTVKTRLTGIRAIKLEALTHASLPGSGPGRGDAARPNFVLNRFALEARPFAGGVAKPIAFIRATADFSQKSFDVAGAIDDDPKTAWAINPEFHEPHWAQFEIGEPIGFDDGTILTFTLEQNFGGARTIGRLRLTAVTGRAGGKTLPNDVAAALQTSSGKRTKKQVDALLAFRLRDAADYQGLLKSKSRLEAELKQLRVPTTLVMRELPEPRESFMFQRGDFRTLGDPIRPATPAVLHRSIAPGSATRLDLARWLVDRENPLTARVTVNRWWAELLGRGIVATPEDFGIKGELPTHPDLLDWLAVELVEHGWSMKHVLRTIVASATYRQQSKLTPELLAKDDQNQWYARAPRQRLDAELIRDNALSIAGLINHKLGGPPIRPYQPDGLWIKVGGEKYDYVVSPGDEKFRRGLYVVWKRGAPYPSFVNFDANARLACRVKRPRSNTPLQALTLLNDPVYVEIAKAFALRVMKEKADANVDARILHAFRLAIARAPVETEIDVLRKLYFAERSAAESNKARIQKLIGDITLPSNVSPEEFAAWYAVCTAILNLDETISKG